MPKKKVTEPLTRTADLLNLSTSDIAFLTGLTPQHVSKLNSQRTIKQNGKRGKYNGGDAVPAYINSLRTSGAAEAKARLAVQQERKLRLGNDKEAALLIKIDDAAEALRTYCLIWRAGANALPRRLAIKLGNESNPKAIHRIMTDEFHGLFYEMEAGLTEFFASQGHDFGVTKTGPNGASPAPRKKAKRKRKSVKSKKVTARRRKVVTNERTN